MIIESLTDMEFFLSIAIDANREITSAGKFNVINQETLESTFSSCVYYDTERLQYCSIVNKLTQNQSFIDGNKRTSLFMLHYLNSEFNLGLIERTDEEIAKIIVQIAVEKWSVEKTCKILFNKFK